MGEQRCFYLSYTHSATDMAKRMWFYVNSVGWFACRPTYDVWRSSFYDFQLMYVLRGQGTVTWRGQTFPVGPGDVVFLDLNEEHRYAAVPSDPWEILWVHTGGQQLPAYFELLGAQDCPVYTGDSIVGRLFGKLISLFQERSTGLEPTASSILYRVLNDLVRVRMTQGFTPLALESASYPDVVRHAVEFMEHNYDQPLTLDDIAQQASLSVYHFARLFKQSTGLSVMEYLLRIRMVKAKHLLAETELSIREISERVGFADQGYFGKMFKRFEDMTPKAYRLRSNLQTALDADLDK